MYDITSLISLVREFESRFKKFAVKSGTDLRYIEGIALINLEKQDGLRISDLADSVYVPRTSFTPILDKLEKSGFLERRADPIDRRSVKLFLTAKGIETVPLIKSCMREAKAEVVPRNRKKIQVAKKVLGSF